MPSLSSAEAALAVSCVRYEHAALRLTSKDAPSECIRSAFHAALLKVGRRGV